MSRIEKSLTKLPNMLRTIKQDIENIVHVLLINIKAGKGKGQVKTKPKPKSKH